MKAILVAALFSIGLGLAAPTGAAAANATSGLKDAAQATSLVKAARCRNVQTCRTSPIAGYRRVCSTKRVCD